MNVPPASTTSALTRRWAITRADRTIGGWLVAWAGFYSVAMGMISRQGPWRSLSPETQTLVGAIMGGLAAVWVTAATWAILIDLAAFPGDTRKHYGPRLGVAAVIVINAAILALLGDVPVYPPLTITLLSIVPPLVIWQWSGQRISRMPSQPMMRKSIRQLFEITGTLAIAFATFNAVSGQSDSATVYGVMGLIHGLIGTVLLLTLLGRWWWTFGITLLLLPLHSIAIVSLIDFAAPKADAHANSAAVMAASLFLHSILFLLLMRSSRLRWYGRTGYPPEHQPLTATSSVN